MSRLFYGNFAFEHELAERGALARTLRRVDAELAAVWVAVAETEDVIWTPEPFEDGFPAELVAYGFPELRTAADWRDVSPGLTFQPWGWTDAARRLARDHGCRVEAPPQDAVRAVNSRRFSYALEQEWGVALEGAAAIGSVEELAAALRRLPGGCDRWVVKAEFGMSARERIRGAGREPSAQIANWVRRRIAGGGVVFLEPWVERIDEVGLQFTIPPGDPPVFEGLTPLLSGRGGEYRGSRFEADAAREAAWADAIACGRRTAARVADAGYFGPLGIDAMRYRTADGMIRLRPVQDINARWTMGRLSLGLRRFLAPGETGAWLHGRWPDAAAHHGIPPHRIIPTSPRRVSGQTTSHGTWLVMAESEAELCAVLDGMS